MTANTEVVSIRLPVNLLGEIDEIIASLGFCQTRAEYIVRSLDSYFRILIATRQSIDRQVEQLKSIQEIDPNTILSITKAAMDVYMKKYEQYEGDRQQVLLRIPLKVLNHIENYRTDIALYDNRADFIRFAVSNQIDADKALLTNMDKVHNHRIIQTRSTEEIVSSVLNGLQDPNSPSLEGLVNLATLFINESTKVKKP